MGYPGQDKQREKFIEKIKQERKARKDRLFGVLFLAAVIILPIVFEIYRGCTSE